MNLSIMDIPLLFDDLSDGLWDLDIKNHLISLSHNASKLFGHKQPVTLNRKEMVNTCIHKDHKNKLHNEINSLFENRIDVMDAEIKLKSLKNGLKWIRLKAKTISWDSNGNPTRIWGTVTDISKRKKAEEEIEKERKILRTIIDNLPVTVYAIDKNGRKILSNRADCEIIGAKDESEVIGKTDIELFPGKVGERGHNDNMYVIVNNKPVVNHEEYFLDKNGNEKWLLTSKIPFFKGDNRIAGLVGIGMDITEQKSLQQKVVESETFYRTLVNINPEGVVVTDLEGKMTFISEKAYKKFKISETESQIGKSVFDWVAPESSELAKAYFVEALGFKKPPKPRELKFINSEDVKFWAEITVSPLFDYTGKTTGLMVIGHDITDRKKAEQELIAAKNKAEENDKLKTALLQNISHEIRTPMNAIVGFTSMLTECEEKQEMDSYISIIQNNTQQLLSIISDLVDISTIEAGTIRKNETTFNVNTILRGLYNQYSIKASEKRLVLDLKVGLSDQKSSIITDQTRLIQIISNLINNSFKFTREGSIYFGYVPKGSFLEFYVSDTGIGIAEEHHSAIFKSFYQVETSLSRKYGGTGLGLSICKAYVELLGGHIWLTSKVGEGTTFYFTLPFNRISPH